MQAGLEESVDSEGLEEVGDEVKIKLQESFSQFNVSFALLQLN